MESGPDPLQILDDMVTSSVKRGLGHLDAGGERLDGRTIRVGSRELIHFGSCSYLGLELDPRLKAGSIDAVSRFGTYFSSSRAFVSAPLYAELEAEFEKIFGAHVLVAPTTTLAHLAALPVLCERRDALILDHLAHHSLHLATHSVRAGGARVELVRHNQLELVEEMVERLRSEHRRIWYVADGVYSMHGDLAPVEALTGLLDRNEQLHAYVDDAHGMSWYGEHGRGYTLGRVPLHERMVVATSLAKCFGTGGAVLVFRNQDWRRKVRTCGGPMIFSGPLAPAVVGAALAGTRIHLYDEIYELQAWLRERVGYCNQLMRRYELPLVSESITPLFFVGTRNWRVAQTLVSRLIEDGFFTNVAHFPSVSTKRAGVRFTLTLHHERDDIRALVESLARHLPAALEAEQMSVEDVRRAFHLQDAGRPAAPAAPRPAPGAALRLEHGHSIAALDAAEWNRLLGSRGSFAADGLAFLEDAFAANPDAHGNWEFHYYAVRDRAGRLVLATFFSDALWKDDMLAPEKVSRRVEERRAVDPSHLVSRVFGMGSLLTEGNHLYLDRSRDWRSALSMLLQKVGLDAEERGAHQIALRDLPDDDPELNAFLVDRGFTKIPLPESFELIIDWRDDSEWLGRLSRRARRHQQREVRPWERAYESEVFSAATRTPSAAELARLRELYLNVKGRSLALNTFDLPEAIFEKMLRAPGFEIWTLRLEPEFGGKPSAGPVAMGACYVGSEHYVPLVLGLDYGYVQSHGLYRQCLLHAVRRAQHHGLRSVLFGMGSPLEKRRFGARPQRRCLYAQVDDHYGLDVVAALGAEAPR